MAYELIIEVAQAAPWAPWWARWLAIVAVVALIAGLMVMMQTRHKPPRGAAWVAVVVFIPILGPLIYIIAQTVSYHRHHPKPTKGRAETMAPEEVIEARRREQGPSDS